MMSCAPAHSTIRLNVEASIAARRRRTMAGNGALDGAIIDEATEAARAMLDFVDLTVLWT
jgi:hypothetical protein